MFGGMWQPCVSFRAYVLGEMFAGMDKTPERHDLTLFPTVNDLKNHIHQAIKDIESGMLGVTASTVCFAWRFVSSLCIAIVNTVCGVFVSEATLWIVLLVLIAFSVVKCSL
jgi:hypothetical protein